MPKKDKNKGLKQGTICLRDLREGKYKALPIKKCAGNIFMTGNEFYIVTPSTSWKKVTDPEERATLIKEFNFRLQTKGMQHA